MRFVSTPEQARVVLAAAERTAALRPRLVTYAKLQTTHELTAVRAAPCLCVDLQQCIGVFMPSLNVVGCSHRRPCELTPRRQLPSHPRTRAESWSLVDWRACGIFQRTVSRLAWLPSLLGHSAGRARADLLACGWCVSVVSTERAWRTRPHSLLRSLLTPSCRARSAPCASARWTLPPACAHSVASWVCTSRTDAF